ncbi:MAG: MerR family transcriptional regulator [bacterium]
MIISCGGGKKMQRYRIGEVSKMVDVPVETIRFLEQKGLVSPEKNTETGYRFTAFGI